MVEGAALIVALLVLTDLASHHDVPYVIFPALIWAVAALRPARRGRGTAGRLCAHDLGHLGRLRPVRAQLAERQPDRDAAVRRRGRADLDDPGRGDGRARGERGRGARARARAGRAPADRDARRQRGRSRARLRAGHARGGAGARRGDGDDRPLRRTPHASRSWAAGARRGSLLFPVGSTIEIGGESSALVEVYRTGEARRVTYPKDAGEPHRGPALPRLPLERRRAGQARRRALGRARRLLDRRAPAARRLRAAPLRLRRPRRPGARQRRCARQAGRVARAHRRARATPSAGVSSATSTTARSSAWSRSRCSCG